MATPTWVDTLEVTLHDDTTERFSYVGFYAHRYGLDIVDEHGDYVRRFGTEEFLRYDGNRPAIAATA